MRVLLMALLAFPVTVVAQSGDDEVVCSLPEQDPVLIGGLDTLRQVVE
ncbi:MAG: hypothetical protein AAF791_06895 [Bacteroidota bacterium]